MAKAGLDRAPVTTAYLAFDLGAESGRAILARLRSGILSIEEIHRFANEPVRYHGELHWDVPRLWLEVQNGLKKAAREANALEGIAVDTWGLDYALLGEGGVLLENPHHYRDARTDGIMERVFALVPPEEIFSTTGIQFMQINTLYQLFAASRRTPRVLELAERLLTIPDLLNYWLTGVCVCEYTNATTTQFLEARSRSWARDMLDRLGVPTHFLGPIVEPGTVLGKLLAELADQSGLPQVPVIAPACHDTGSAVAAVSSSGRTAFISSGTWSLLGTEVAAPVISATAQRLNFSNEGGVCGTFRLLKNIAGMWLLHSCRRYWETAGQSYDYPELIESARASPALRSLVDPDHPSFLRADDMPESIAAFCVRTGQPVPNDPGAYTRLVLESLALKYRYVLDSLESITGTVFEEVRIVGGGARNGLLNQFTAEATGRRVVAGPVEATALGNVAMQLLATGAVSSLREARLIIDRSFPADVYEPIEPGPWREAYQRFRQYCGSGSPAP